MDFAGLGKGHHGLAGRVRSGDSHGVHTGCSLPSRERSDCLQLAGSGTYQAEFKGSTCTHLAPKRLHLTSCDWAPSPGGQVPSSGGIGCRRLGQSGVPAIVRKGNL